MSVPPWFRRIEGLGKVGLARLGIAVTRRPAPFLRDPAFELRINLPMLIDHHLAQHRPDDFFFVQVGAFDGTGDDPIRPLVERYGWRGVLIEPQRGAFERLKATYDGYSGLRFERLAIAPRRERRTLYTVRLDPPSSLPTWAEEIASFSREHLLAHRSAIPNIDRLIEEETVECEPLEAVLDRLGVPQLDLLQIDAEGYDLEVLRTLDLERWTPSFVHFEHKHLSRSGRAAAAQLLLAHGYRLAFGTKDTLAYREASSRPRA